MEPDFLLACLIVFLVVLGYGLYIRQMLTGASKPNAVTWTLSLFIVVLNGKSYLDMSGDIMKTILPIVSAVLLLVLYTILITKVGLRFAALEAVEWWAFGLGIVAAVIWWWFKSATYANLLFQAPIALSFFPMLKGVWKNPLCEKPDAWWVFTLAYIVSLILLVLRWTGHPLELVFPIGGVFFHALVALFCYRTPSAVEEEQ
jgi:uncharacterized membrane protein YfhO